ncbi:MAG: NeuD/PglB/VioB family sugar acetyltransferase [Tissierellaceae bacterium]|nr:NeuD/PglB/VioB family sugar acetyltransferase [Tissierellaceae bacterium]
MDKSVYIVGAGTYGEAMFELAEMHGYKVKGFFDEDDEKQNEIILNSRVIGKFSELNKRDIKNKKFIVAIGNNKIRYEIMTTINDLGGRTPTLIHPKATISPSAEIGKGVYIQANAYIWTKVQINDFSIISPNVVIAHHTTVGKACLISTLTGVGASIKIGDRVFIGMGATIVTGLKLITSDVTIGAGTLVLKDIREQGVYVGVPARKIQ